MLTSSFELAVRVRSRLHCTHLRGINFRGLLTFLLLLPRTEPRTIEIWGRHTERPAISIFTSGAGNLVLYAHRTPCRIDFDWQTACISPTRRELHTSVEDFGRLVAGFPFGWQHRASKNKSLMNQCQEAVAAPFLTFLCAHCYTF